MYLTVDLKLKNKYISQFMNAENNRKTKNCQRTLSYTEIKTNIKLYRINYFVP